MSADAPMTFRPAWAGATVGALGDVVCGQSPRSSEVNDGGRGTPYVSGPEQWEGASIKLNKWTTAQTPLAPERSVFITVKGAGVGKLFPGIAAAIGRDIYAFKPAKDVDFRFIYRALEYSVSDLILRARGDIPGLSKADILRHAINVPGPRTQSKVASKIDELFSRIDEGEQALKRVEKLVERYRQSVLKAAVTGELTRDWRAARKRAGDPVESGEALLARILKARRAAWEAAELAKLKAKGKAPADDRWKQKYQEPVPPDATDLPPLPEGWVWASVAQLVNEFGNGLSRKPAEQPPGVPILRISAVRPMSVDSADVRYYQPTEHEELADVEVRAGDLLFTRYNGSKDLVGACGTYKGDVVVLHPDKLIKARVTSTDVIAPDFLMVACNAGFGAAHIASCVKTSAGQHGISGSDIKRTPIPLPPEHEQARILEVIDKVVRGCTATLIGCSAETRHAASLRQSILKAAFSGQLVPQDPNDEPASKLLERIAAERAGAVPAPRKRTKKIA